MFKLNTIHNKDCLTGIQRIPDGSIDAIICDLPYGTTKNKWDSVLPMDLLWSQYRRIIKPDGVIALFAQTPFDNVLGCSNLEWLKYEWIWCKDNSTGFLNANHAPLKVHENILIFSSASQTTNAIRQMKYNPQFGIGEKYARKKYARNQSTNYGNQIDCTMSNDGSHYYPTDILYFGRDKDKLHPTQKPVDLIRYLIRTYTNEGDTVLDNCMGS